jgi:hypothetical protein
MSGNDAAALPLSVQAILIETRDTKMPAQMKDIYRTEIAGDSDQCHAARAFR